jgi:hypothetical protein
VLSGFPVLARIGALATSHELHLAHLDALEERLTSTATSTAAVLVRSLFSSFAVNKSKAKAIAINVTSSLKAEAKIAGETNFKPIADIGPGQGISLIPNNTSAAREIGAAAKSMTRQCCYLARKNPMCLH